MTIDFHTHIYPDALAPRGLAAVLKNVEKQYVYTPMTDMTARGLLEKMDLWGIDLSVVQPIITKQTQTKKVNEWARSLFSDRLLSFGGIWPHTDDYKRDIDFVADLGLKGLKFHPEYQQFTVDDAQMMKIYEYAAGKGLPLLFHGGADPGFSEPYHSSPRQFANIARDLRGADIIVAHLGGQKQWDDVERDLAGSDVYLDTSIGFAFYSEEQFLRIVRTHGTDRILFASDSPWSNTAEERAHILSLPGLSAEDREKILWRNAKRLLQL